LEQVGGICLDHTSKGLVCFFPDGDIHIFGTQLRVGFKQLFAWWCGNPGPQLVEHLASHLDEEMAQGAWCFGIGDDCDTWFKELSTHLGKICPILVHKANKCC
jgi:hypothetical protein